MTIRRWLFPKGYRAAYHYNRGTSAYQRGELVLAEALLRESLRLWPRYPEALHNLGLALAAQDRCEEALEVYEQALEERSDFPEAYNNYGIALAKVGRLPDAIAAFNNALRQKPNYLKAQQNLDGILRILDRHKR